MLHFCFNRLRFCYPLLLCLSHREVLRCCRWPECVPGPELSSLARRPEWSGWSQRGWRPEYVSSSPKTAAPVGPSNPRRRYTLKIMRTYHTCTQQLHPFLSNPVWAYPECPLVSPRSCLWPSGWTAAQSRPFGGFPRCPGAGPLHTLADAPSWPSSSSWRRLNRAQHLVEHRSRFGLRQKTPSCLNDKKLNYATFLRYHHGWILRAAVTFESLVGVRGQPDGQAEADPRRAASDQHHLLLHGARLCKRKRKRQERSPINTKWARGCENPPQTITRPLNPEHRPVIGHLESPRCFNALVGEFSPRLFWEGYVGKCFLALGWIFRTSSDTNNQRNQSIYEYSVWMLNELRFAEENWNNKVKAEKTDQKEQNIN